MTDQGTLDLMWMIRDIRDPRVDGAAKALLYSLLAHRTKRHVGDVVVFSIAASVEQLANGAGLSRATAMRQLPRMEHIGLIGRVQRSRRSMIEYTINLPEWSQGETAQRSHGETTEVSGRDRSVVSSMPPSGLRVSPSEDLGSEDQRRNKRIPLVPALERAGAVDRIWAYERAERKRLNDKTPTKIRPSRKDKAAIIEALDRGLPEGQIVGIIWAGLHFPWTVADKQLDSLVHALRHDRVDTNWETACEYLAKPKLVDGVWQVETQDEYRARQRSAPTVAACPPADANLNARLAELGSKVRESGRIVAG